MDKDFKSSHMLMLTRFDVFLKFIAENRKDIDKRYRKQLLFSGTMSLLLYPFVLAEDLFFTPRDTKEPLKEPIFILGHWRSGTTLLQYYLNCDKRFGGMYPLMAFAYNFYHTLGWAFKEPISEEMAAGRPMDNMKFAMDLPQEEYITYCLSDADSFYALNMFPQAFMKYSEFIFVNDLPRKKRAHWVRKNDMILRKCASLNGGKRMVLKSPDNTARVAVLKHKYPDAKFINIYRNPYTVIRSTVNLYKKVFEHKGLEKEPDDDLLEDMVIEVFKRMYETFFREIKRLPKEDFFEIKFEDFEKDPLPFMEQAYSALGIEGFEKVRGAMEKFREEQKDYKKNEFDYPERLVKKVEDRLGFYFEHYGYEKGISNYIGGEGR